MEDLDYKKLGGRIRAVREAQELTQEAASERCDITTAFYGNIERGDRKMSVDTLYKIAVGLGVSTDTLLFGDEPSRKDKLEEILGKIQQNCDNKQFEKFLAIVETLATVINQL